MPIASLPIEIVHEIASHLRAPPFTDSHQAVEDGQSMSLACRSWYPIGQELRWRSIQVDIVAVPSLLVHFDLHPHLPRLVFGLDQSHSSPSETETDQEQKVYESLPKLLSTLGELRTLHLRPINSTFEPVFQATASLPLLTTMLINPGGNLSWSKTIDTTFAQGFPSIREFYLLSTHLVVVDEGLTVSTNSNLKKLQRLSLTWSGSIDSSPVPRILANLDFAVLQSLLVGGVPACTFPFESLARCTSLEYLRVYDSSQFFDSTFPTLIANLSEVSSLAVLEYHVDGGGTAQASYASTITLEELYNSVPPSLEIVQVKQVAFARCDSVEDQPLVAINSGNGFCVVQGLAVTPKGNRCMYAWKALGKKESKSYRSILSRSPWNEDTTRYIVSYSTLLR